jgi:hypothetical protein
MNRITILLCLLLLSTLQAQDKQELAVQETIKTFFDGFHRQDSLLIKSTASSGIILQTIGKNKAGGDSVLTESFGRFLKSIVQIPDSVQFEERIKSFKIQVDGPMAHAWTPYEFYVNGTLSHCGVNSFQLFLDRDVWQIIYIIDTRRRGDCL